MRKIVLRTSQTHLRGFQGLLLVFLRFLKDRNLWPIFAMALCFSFPFATIGGLWLVLFCRIYIRLTSWKQAE